MSRRESVLTLLQNLFKDGRKPINVVYSWFALRVWAKGIPSKACIEYIDLLSTFVISEPPLYALYVVK